ncbi:MAG: DUF4268 domain-containing protein [Chloroflexi bacterium]|nr:DUF4268 domain-containing protein [Chloroflexota bacterium]
MTTAQELGTFQRVGLRSVWGDEAADFTPWLADNISLLGDALGMNLELRKKEAPVGGFSLDILAHDRGNDRPVVIENQLGTTDHSHLGQLLTYAGGFNANVAVWIAGEFRDEHREALDLLNQRTDEDTQFFGIEMELTKIGNSLPAPNFKLVAIPRKWRNPKRMSGGSKGTRTAEKYRQFYQELLSRLNEKAPEFADKSVEEVDATHYCSLAPAGKNVRYSASFGNFAGYQVWVQLGIRSDDRDWDKKLFNQLEKYRDEIEDDLGESLVWRIDHFRHQSGIMVPREGSIDDSAEALQDIQDWMVERLLKFKEVFGPRLAELVD